MPRIIESDDSDEETQVKNSESGAGCADHFNESNGDDDVSNRNNPKKALAIENGFDDSDSSDFEDEDGQEEHAYVASGSEDSAGDEVNNDSFEDESEEEEETGFTTRKGIVSLKIQGTGQLSSSRVESPSPTKCDSMIMDSSSDESTKCDTNTQRNRLQKTGAYKTGGALRKLRRHRNDEGVSDEGGYCSQDSEAKKPSVRQLR
jgi:hypothetical protein